MSSQEALTPQREDVYEILLKNGANVEERAPFSFSRIGEGRGFCSLLYGVRWGEERYAVKITNPRGSVTGAEGSVGLHENVHDREIDFYQWKEEYLKDGRKREDVETIANYYGGTKCSGKGKEGLIVMEDFSSRLTSEVDFTKGFSVEIVRGIIKAIVGYQSAYLKADKKFPTTDKSLVHNALKTMTTHCVTALPEKSWLPKDGEIRKALIAIGEKTQQLQDTIPEFAKDLPLTLTHCDLWPNNMLFQKIKDQPELLAIVDWQCASVGNPLLDVASAIGVCLNAEERRAKEEEMVEYWREEMNKRRKREEKMEREMVHSLYRHSLQWAALQLIYTAVFNPSADKAEEGEEDGPLSKRLRAIVEDIGIGKE